MPMKQETTDAGVVENTPAETKQTIIQKYLKSVDGEVIEMTASEIKEMIDGRKLDAKRYIIEHDKMIDDMAEQARSMHSAKCLYKVILGEMTKEEFAGQIADINKKYKHIKDMTDTELQALTNVLTVDEIKTVAGIN